MVQRETHAREINYTKERESVWVCLYFYVWDCFSKRHYVKKREYVSQNAKQTKRKCEINYSKWRQFNHFTLHIHTCIYHHHHHHVVLLALISLILCCHFSLSFIASGRSSGLHPISSHSCCMYVLAVRPAFARPYVGVHRITSLMSSSLLLQQCPACLVRLTWIVFVMGDRWPYSWCFAGGATRTYSILLAIFLCSCRLASSPAVLLASKWCIHTAVLTRPLPGRNCVSFYRSGLISIWSIAYR